MTGDERSCSVRRTITVGHAHIEVPKDQLAVQVGTIEDARAYTYPSDLSVRWTLGGAKATFVVDDGVGSPGKIVDGTESLAPQVGPVPDDAKDAINDVPLPDPKIEGMIPPTIELESTDNPAQICFLEEGDVELSLFCGPDPGSSLTQIVGIKAKPLEMSIKENTTNKPDRVCTGEVVRLTFDINLDRDGPGPWREIPRDIKEQRYVIRCPGVIIKAQAPGFTTKILQKQSGKSHYATVQRKGSNKKTGRFTLTVDVKHQGAGEHQVTVSGIAQTKKGTSAKSKGSATISTMKVTLKLEDNGPKDKNVLIVGDPAATKKPECDLKIDVTGPTAGTVVELELSQTGSGSVGASDAKPKVTVGTTKVVKVWGEKASDAIDGKEIAARRKGKKGVCATLKLTVIEGLVLHYEGSFEVRMALDPDPTFHPSGRAFSQDPNVYSPPIFNAAGQQTNYVEGRGYKLKGEGDFDRLIRFSDPVGKRVACGRKFVPVTVAKITVVKPKSAEALFAADDVLKQAVNLGPNCWFNGTDATPGNEPIDCGGNKQPTATTGDPTQMKDRHLVFKVGKATFEGKTNKRYYGGVSFTVPMPADEVKKAFDGKTPKDYYADKIKALEAAFMGLTAAEKAGDKGENLQRRIKILEKNKAFATGVGQPAVGTMEMVGRLPTDRKSSTGQLLSDGIIKKAEAKINPGKSLAMKLFKKHSQYVVKMNVFAFDFDCFDGKVNGTLATKP